jgi:anti-anti-sigma factor
LKFVPLARYNIPIGPSDAGALTPGWLGRKAQMTVSGETLAEGTTPYVPGNVQVSLRGDVSVVTLAGEVDVGLSKALDDACSAVLQRDRPVRVDAGRLTFIDSSGLNFLARLIQAEPGGKPPKVIGASPVVRETIHLVGLADLVEII